MHYNMTGSASKVLLSVSPKPKNYAHSNPSQISLELYLESITPICEDLSSIKLEVYSI